MEALTMIAISLSDSKGVTKRQLLLYQTLMKSTFHLFYKKTVSGIKLKFVDSFRFLQASLSSLAGNLPKDKIIQTKTFFTYDELPLVTRKGVYPYVYTDSWDRLEQMLDLRKVTYLQLPNNRRCK